MSKHTEQAQIFLKQTGTTLIYKKEGDKDQSSVWGGKDEGLKTIVFKVTLRNDRASYIFKWHCSHNNYLAFKHADFGKMEQFYIDIEYSILSSLNPTFCDSFEEFCSNFGYNTDSRAAHKTWLACKEQDTNLSRLFNEDELVLLSEIV